MGPDQDQAAAQESVAWEERAEEALFALRQIEDPSPGQEEYLGLLEAWKRGEGRRPLPILVIDAERAAGLRDTSRQERA